MSLKMVLTKCLLLLVLVDRAFLVPTPISQSPSVTDQEEESSKVVEIKLPVKITSMEDLIAWAKNAMRSMASRIDITLASVDDAEDDDRDRIKLKSSGTRLKPRERGSSSFEDKRERVHSPGSDSRINQREPVSVSFDSARPGAASALLSTYVNLLSTGGSYDSIIDDHNGLGVDSPNYGNFNAYLPLLLDEAEIAKYREDALRKYYTDKDQGKREKERKDTKDKKDKKGNRYSQAVAQQTSNVHVGSNDAKGSTERNNKESNNKQAPVISVPFEAVVTITRENLAEPTRQSHDEIRDPPDEFPPYFEKDYPRRGQSGDKETSKRNKVTSEKRQISSLGDLLRMLGLTKRVTTNKTDGNQSKGSNAQSTNTRVRKPNERFSPPPLIQFEDEPPRQRRNETSQRQELEEDNEESEEEEGSLGSLTDLLPLVIPILEDLSDPESDADLGEVLEAAIPLLEGLFENEDPSTPGILDMIGPILMTILGGKDGTGSDVGALIGPLLQVIGPLVGPLSGPLFAAISGGGGAGGSSVGSLLQAAIAPLAQPGPDGTSPLSTITASVITAVLKDLKPGQPGGLDIGALVGGVLSGALSGTSAGLSGSSSADKNQPYGTYGPYGAGPAQAGSTNNRINAGYVVPGQPINSLHQKNPLHHQQTIAVPVNFVEHQRIVNRPSHTPYATIPQKLHPQSSSPQFQNYVQHPAGPLQAGTTNSGNGGSSYLPYGNNAVPAASANPLGLVTDSIKDILGGGINLVSSLITAVFGISGASSSSDDKPTSTYGVPAQGGYH